VSAPETLPCGHTLADNLFENANGAKVLITIPPAEPQFGDAPPGAVWCAQCLGWQHAPADEVARYAAVRV